MRSLVFNNPIVVFWFSMLFSFIIGVIISGIIFLIFRKRIVSKEVHAAIPKERQEYLSQLSEYESRILDLSDLNVKYKRSHHEAVLRASQLITAIGEYDGK